MTAFFHDGLQRQRRYPKPGMRHIIMDKYTVLIQSLLYSEVGAGVFQLRREGDRLCACDGGEVFAKIGSEIHDDLPGLYGILTAKTVDARHGVVDKVRSHLQHHDAGALIGDLHLLPGDFPLAAQVLIDLIVQYESVHGQGGEGVADIEDKGGFSEKLYDHSGCHRYQCDEKTQKGFATKLLSASDRPCEI